MTRLTQLQKGMVLAGLRAGGKDTNVLQAVVELGEGGDIGLLQSRARSLTGEIDLLRTVVDSGHQRDPAWVVKSEVEAEVGDVALDGPTELSAFLALDRTRGFDLIEGPLWRLTKVSAGSVQFLVFSIHTALADRQTAGRLLAHMMAEGDGDPRPVPGGDTGLGPLVRTMEEQAGPADIGFWRDVLHGHEGPTPSPLSDEGGGEGSPGQRSVELNWSVDLSSAGGEGGLNAMLEAGVSILLSYYGNSERVMFGSVKDLRSHWASVGGGENDGMPLGPAVAPLPVTAEVTATTTFGQLLKSHREQDRVALEHSAVAPLDLMAASGFEAGSGLFQFVLLIETVALAEQLEAAGIRTVSRAWFDETPPYPVMLYATPGKGGVALRLRYDAGRLSDAEAELILVRYQRVLEALGGQPEALVGDVPLMEESDPDWPVGHTLGESVSDSADQTVHEAISRAAVDSPESIALVDGDRQLTYDELELRTDQVARILADRGVTGGDLVALAVDRSIETVVGMVGILKAGAGYVPMDPGYPADRLQFMLEDSNARIALVGKGGMSHVDLSGLEVIDITTENLDATTEAAPETDTDGASVAYVIYTSGSTGRPKGVVVEHCNVLNFFQGMDDRVPSAGPGGVWLAVTSVSFDISVLELLWTLARGFKVVLFDPTAAAAKAGPARSKAGDRLPVGLFYFSAEAGSDDPYRLLMDGARFADKNGFSAVWTPERHFHAFGGLYPNPAVTGAAIAAVTDNIEIRAGSVVLPLHHPARVAEEWSVVDNLSGGRVGLAFASGWHPNDFVLRPEGYENRKSGLFDWADEVQRLWRGEVIEYQGPQGQPVKVTTLPRPVQPELPVWITAAGSPETVRRAAAAGHNLLTHLLGQTITELEDRIRLYREARQEAGHEGPGRVAVMLHTFVGEDDDEVREEVRGPMVEYLRSSMGLVKNHLTAWEAFSKKATQAAQPGGDEFDRLSEEDTNSLLNFSFERYYETSALLGSEERTADLMDRVLQAGATEIASLIDFGVDETRALAALPMLKGVAERASVSWTPGPPAASLGGFAELIRAHGVTHFQCTPSLARLLMADSENTEALSVLKAILIGGEAFSKALAQDLTQATQATVINMYGPTEATVWSSTREVTGAEAWGSMPLGRPLANLSYSVADRLGRALPPGVAGELTIGGASVTRGYLNRDSLTAERFRTLPGRDQRGYRTGDLVRFSPDGELLFLGRIDQQVKIRGHRIELGEIESVIGSHRLVREAAVVLFRPDGGEGRLTGYYVADDGLDPDEIKTWARDRLPDVMVPAHWVKLEALPKTPNLKVDRNALPAPWETKAVAPDAAEAKAGDHDVKAIQELVQEVWCQELGLEEVGLDENFFDMGGHSLLVVQVHLRLKSALSREFAITDLFQYPTVRSLAAALSPDSSSDADEGESRAAKRKRMRQRSNSPG